MKFVLLVEGETEKQAAAAFLKRWLDPQLTQRVGMQSAQAKDTHGNVGRNRTNNVNTE